MIKKASLILLLVVPMFSDFCNCSIDSMSSIQQHTKYEQQKSEQGFLKECENSYYLSTISDDSKVAAENLEKNTTEDIESYGELKKGHCESEKWRGSNLIGRYMDMNITKIIKVTGIYSHFSSYFDHDVLESGTAKSAFDKAGSFTDTTHKSFSFNYGVDYYVESKMEATAKIDVVKASVGVGEKMGASYTYDCRFTRNTMTTANWSEHFSISKITADYCPEGYSLSLGKQGVYYFIEGDYQEMSIWWWGNYPTQGTSKQYFTTVLATPDNFNYCFAYKNKLNTDDDYYKGKTE